MLKNKVLFALFCSLSLFNLQAEKKAETTENKAKKEQVVFLKQDVKKKIAYITVIAAYNAENYGMNFNGHSKGNAYYKIPVGWTVKVRFENWSPVPHSLVIVEQDRVKKPQVGEPYFDGASSPDPTLATAAKKADFSFEIDEAGDFAFACGFPAHSANGQWIGLETLDTIKKAELVVTKKAVANTTSKKDCPLLCCTK